MDADQFLRTLFDQCQGVVVTCSQRFKSRRWVPGRPINPDQVYFCISTVVDPNPRQGSRLGRKTQDLVETCLVVVDDVGTKVSRETMASLLAPTYKLRTSLPEGVSNEQWGWVFDEPVAPERAAALIEAMSQAGLTDPGSKRADRVMRFPGSLNSKYDPPFPSELLEFSGALYSYTDVCLGLKVTPTDTPMLAAAIAELPDGKVDPLVDQIYRLGWVTGDPSAAGWIPITCPWESEHTPGQGAAHGCDYHPGWPSGVFKCQHAHGGQSPTDADFKGVLADEAMVGMGDRLAAALGVQQPAVDPGDSPAAGREDGNPQAEPTLSQSAFEALQAQLAGNPMFSHRMGTFDLRAGILGDLIHVGSEDGYWSIEAKCLLTHKAVDDRWFSLMLPSGMLDRFNAHGAPLAPMAVTIWLRRQVDTQRVSRIIHRLGSPLIVDDCLNIAPLVPERLIYCGEPEPWLDLIAFVCKDVALDIECVLDWMALVATDWTQKPGWHLLLRGAHGTGKNLALRPLVKYTKPLHHQNVSAADIGGQFTAFLTKRLISVDELKMTSRGSISTHDIYNNVKAWTARGYDTLTINDKHMKRYEASDLSAWVVTSNAAVPLPLEEGDRRFMVIETPLVPWPTEDYDEVIAWLDAGGDEMVIAWLHRRWDSMPAARRARLFGRAPDTDAKRELIDASAEGIEGGVRLGIAGQHCTPWPDLMRLDDVVARLKDPQFELLTDQVKRQVSTQRVIPALKAAGAVRMFNGEVIKHGDRSMRLWCMRASKAHIYTALGQGKGVLDAYAELRAGRSVKPDLRVVPSEKL